MGQCEKGTKGQRSKGQIEKLGNRTTGHLDNGIMGPWDKVTEGKRGNGTKRQRNNGTRDNGTKRQKGQKDKRTKRQLTTGQWMGKWMGQWENGTMGQWEKKAKSLNIFKMLCCILGTCTFMFFSPNLLPFNKIYLTFIF